MRTRDHYRHIATCVQDGIDAHGQSWRGLSKCLVGDGKAEVVDIASDGCPAWRHADTTAGLVPRCRGAIEGSVPSQSQGPVIGLRPGQTCDAESRRDVDAAHGRRVLARGEERHIELQGDHDRIVGRAREGLALIHRLCHVRDVTDVLRAKILSACIEKGPARQREGRGDTVGISTLIKYLWGFHDRICNDLQRLKLLCFGSLRVSQSESQDIEITSNQTSVMSNSGDQRSRVAPVSRLLMAHR